MYRRLAAVAAASAPAYFCLAPRLRVAFADTETPNLPKASTAKIVIEDDNEAEDDAEWMAEKEKCSFCKSFLHSPCKIQFRQWMKCIDKSKELEVDMVAACADYSTLLFACTADNQEYFESLIPADGNDEDEENSDDESVLDAIETSDVENVTGNTEVLEALVEDACSDDTNLQTSVEGANTQIS